MKDLMEAPLLSDNNSLGSTLNFEILFYLENGFIAGLNRFFSVGNPAA